MVDGSCAANHMFVVPEMRAAYMYMSCVLACGFNSDQIAGRGDDTVGNPHRAQIWQFELFELVLLLKLDKQLPIERFEATVSQSTVPSPPLRYAIRDHMP